MRLHERYVDSAPHELTDRVQRGHERSIKLMLLTHQLLDLLDQLQVL